MNIVKKWNKHFLTIFMEHIDGLSLEIVTY